MQKSASLAKLLPPRLTQVFPRTRLFGLLDKLRNEQAVIWMASPPGSGKTTLVGHYLEQRKLKSLWYQIDEGDSDAANFFHYLGIAAAKLSNHRQPLPHLTPEYFAGVATFTRRYFEKFFSRIKPPFVLVLDNYQELAPDSFVHDAVSIAASLAPPGVTLMVTSRNTPTAGLAKAWVNGGIKVVGWDALRLTPDEAAGVVAQRGRGDIEADALQRLHQQTDGWVAGLVLALEQGRGTFVKPDVGVGGFGEAATQQTLFDYFTAEIFNRTTPETQEMLLKTALVSQFNADMAAEITGNPSAGQLLDELYQKNFFTYRQGAESDSRYQYHPLFHTFLLARGAMIWDAAEMTSCRLQAARLLEKNDRPDDALTLYVDAEDWVGAIRLLLRHAPTLASQGRFASLGAVIERIPVNHYAMQPWVHYWLGVARLARNPGGALAPFEAAYAGFERADDRRGICLALAGATDAIGFSMQDLSQYDPWLQRLDVLLASTVEFPDKVIEAKLVTSVVQAINWREPTHPALPDALARARRLLRHPFPAPILAQLGSFVLLYMYWHDADDAEFRRIFDQLARLNAQLAAFPFERIFSRLMRVNLHACRGEHTQAMALFDETMQDAEQSGMHLMNNQCIGVTAWACLGMGDLVNADALIKRLGSQMSDSTHKLDQCLYQHLIAWRSALAGNYSTAVKEITVALRLNDELHSVFTYELARHCLAQYQLAGGDAEAARETLAHPDSLRDGNGFVALVKYVAKACLALTDGNVDKTRRNVARVMEIARRGDIVSSTGSLSVLHAKVCAFAIEHDIDADAACGMIQRLRLQPPPDAVPPDNWPWSVKIYTLGHFDIEIDGKPLRFTGKTQKKPLELLMALISFGGQGVGESRLSAALWGAATAKQDTSATSFAMTLHRLRKLLGDEDTVLLSNRKLSLNPQKVWVDAYAIDRLFSHAESGKPATTPAQAGARRILGLYQGAFLSESESLTWTLVLREKLRVKYLRFIERAVQLNMEKNRHEDALQLIDNGLDAEPLAEELYFQRMTCQAALGQRVAALVTYRRCQQMLSVLLGIQPSKKTQTLYHGLLNNQKLS